MSSGTYSLTSTPNDRFLRSFFMAVFARNLLRWNRRGNIFFHISFWCLTCDMKSGFTSNKPIHYLLDHGDFIHSRPVLSHISSSILVLCERMLVCKCSKCSTLHLVHSFQLKAEKGLKTYIRLLQSELMANSSFRVIFIKIQPNYTIAVV